MSFGSKGQRETPPCVENQFKIKGLVSQMILKGFLLLVLPASLYANPQDGVVSSGSANISSNATSVIINQTSNKAVIDWRSFNIDPSEKTQFIHPSSSAITINRIDANQGVSKILGQLSANGQVWLINPAGIFFGSSAQVNVSSLLATTANITNADFQSGNYHFIQPPVANGAIINQGLITVAEKGLVGLVAPGVENSGIIQAEIGSVVLAAGTEFTLDFYGDQIIQFGLNSKVTTAAVDQNGRTLTAGVNNTGTIKANGGKVLLTANTAEQIINKSINTSGYIEAKAAVERNGNIILMGGDEGEVHVSGTLNASGKQAGEKGGSVKILGNKIALLKNTQIDASGDKGGGQVLVGGAFQGRGPEMNAAHVYVDNLASIAADAITAGNGGNIVIWSQGNTNYYGTISAKGGLAWGNGGSVEVSGKENLNFQGIVDTSAVSGNFGELLLDPKFLEIRTTGGSAYSNNTNNLFANNAGATNIITPASINAANANITLQATTDVTFTDALALTNANRNLTVNAGRSILINNNINTTSGRVTMTANDNSATSNRDPGAGNITMAAGTTINSGGDFINLSIETTANAIFTPGSMSLASLTTGGGTVTLNSANGITLNSSINSGAGAITINANTAGSSGQNFIMNTGSSIATTNTSTAAVTIRVNSTTAGDGNATIGAGNITTGAAGTITIDTSGNGNSTGGSIIQSGTGTLNAGANGKITLRTPTANSASIGTSNTPILTAVSGATAAINVIYGTSGVFISNAGSLNISNSTGSTITANAPLSFIVTGAGNTLTLPGAFAINTGSGSQYFESSSILAANTIRLYSTGSITLVTNTITGTPTQIGGSAAATGVASNVIIEGLSGTTIGIAGGAGTLQLPTTLLNTVRASNVRIGDLTNGNITIGAWNPGASNANFAANGIISLATNGSITQTGAINLTNVINAGLIINGGVNATTVTLNNTGNIFNNLAANLSSTTSGGTLAITNAAGNNLTITSLTDDLGTVNGITAPSAVTLLVSAGAGGVLNLNSNITTSSGNGAISLTSGTGGIKRGFRQYLFE
jgi:filamentous hemagglutinin family protein